MQQTTPPAENAPAGNEPNADTQPVEGAEAASDSGQAMWWIIGGLAAVGLGGGAFWWSQRKPEGSEQEGGSDLYTRFIDDETTN